MTRAIHVRGCYHYLALGLEEKDQILNGVEENKTVFIPCPGASHANALGYASTHPRNWRNLLGRGNSSAWVSLVLIAKENIQPARASVGDKYNNL